MMVEGSQKPVLELVPDKIVKVLMVLPDEQRSWVLNHFCRVCHKYIGDKTDWSGSNHCIECSPDPKE